MFDGPELRGVCEIVTQKALKEASELTDQEALGATAEELVEEIFARHDIEVPALCSEERYLVEGGSRQGIELHVRFTGTYGLLHNQPNVYGSQHPPGDVVGDEIVVPLTRAAGADAIADRWIQQVEMYLGYVEHDINIWRDDLREKLRVAVGQRRSRAEQHQRDLRAAGIPIRRRDDAPQMFREPAIVRREAPTRVRAATSQAAEPEVVLSDAYYEHILFVIRAAG
ncbi:MAG: hypothetical protein ACXVII_43475, partial [Solirubrobacteraceae bacterium]